jgi:hypothetical protein
MSQGHINILKRYNKNIGAQASDDVLEIAG